MTEGLITRIGRWLDNKWEAKATESELDGVRELVRESCRDLENHQIADKVELQGMIKAIQKSLDELFVLFKNPSESTKEVADLKTRIEKIELYAGMTRKVDPTKPPVVKSAFSM